MFLLETIAQRLVRGARLHAQETTPSIPTCVVLVMSGFFIFSLFRPNLTMSFIKSRPYEFVARVCDATSIVVDKTFYDILLCVNDAGRDTTCNAFHLFSTDAI